MVMRRKILLDFSDLNILHIECALCKVQLRFDLSKTDFNIPDRCPSCGDAFGSSKHQIEGFRHIFSGLSSSKHKVTIEVDAPEPTTLLA